MQDLTATAPPTPIPQEERSTRRVVHHKGDHLIFTREQIDRLFWVKVGKTADGCWEWAGGRFPHGYGRIDFAKRTLYPHRVSYEIHKGPIPEGLHVDHLCRNRACCNPAHLEAVTCAENIRRSPIAPATINAAKTHCVNGHEFTPENTILIKGGRGRSCRTCRRWHERRTEAKKRGLPLPEAPAQKPEQRLSTSCPKGHPYDEANLYVQANGKRRCRACAAEACRRYQEKRRAAKKDGAQ